MDYLKNGLAELYNSEYPEVGKDSRRRLKLVRAVADNFEKRLTQYWPRQLGSWITTFMCARR